MRKTNGKKRREKASSPVSTKRFFRVKYPLFSFFRRFPKKRVVEEIEKTFLYVSFAYLVVVCLENILRSFFFLFYPEGKLYDCA